MARRRNWYFHRNCKGYCCTFLILILGLGLYGPGRAGFATSRVVVADYRLAGIEIRAPTVPETVAEEEDKASASSGINIF